MYYLLVGINIARSECDRGQGYSEKPNYFIAIL